MTGPARPLALGVPVESVVHGALAVVLFATMVTITAVSYRGYRRYRSRPMKFFAIGFACLLLTQAIIVPAGNLLELDPFVERTVIQTTQILGGLFILYALRMEP
jgi:hypothetical protein